MKYPVIISTPTAPPKNKIAEIIILVRTLVGNKKSDFVYKIARRINIIKYGISHS